jgi:predicted TIM-barrel fold metal-dependent hydrolase
LDLPGFAPGFEPFPPMPAARDRRFTVESPDQLRADLDLLGVDVGVLFPDSMLLHALLKPSVYAVALARAYNRWLTEVWLVEDRGFKGALLAPHQDPAVAAAEIRRYADHPHIGCVYLPTSCVEPLYGHRSYDPLYDAAQECRLPVVLHSVAAIHPVFPFNSHAFETKLSVHIVSHIFAMVANAMSMLETGVPVRFPTLKIVFTEGGIGWVPWLSMKMDKEYAEKRREVPLLTERPSHYLQQMYFATQPIEEPEDLSDVAALFDIVDGENCVLFASDWPHHDFDHPDKVLQIPISLEAKRKVMGLNAASLLGISPERE